jgi:hypothetical protein
MEKGSDTIRVEVAYARPDQEVLIEVHVAAGSTLQQAIEASGVLARFPEIDLSRAKVGVFGKITAPDGPLRAGDRVEIYRPLIADPKEVRRLRAAEGKTMKRGAGTAGEAD